MPPTYSESEVPSNQTALILLRLANIEQKIDRNYDLNSQEFARVHADLQDHETRIRELEREQANLSARLTLAQIIQTSFAAIASAVAGVVGVLVK